MKELLKETKRLLGKAQAVAWATIVEHKGSTPRKAASRMLIRDNGQILGSVGGGRFEAEALFTAKDLFKNPGSQLIDVSMTGQEVAETEMICGGFAKIFVEILTPDALPTINLICERVSGKGDVYLLTCINDGQASFEKSHHILGNDDGDLEASSLSDDLISPVKKQISKGDIPALFAHPQGEGFMFLEPLERSSTLHIFGGGHISLDLAWMAHRVGYEVNVVDDRKAFANRDRFPMASKVQAMPYLEALKGMALGIGDFVVIVTRGHLHDLDVLRGVIAKAPEYIGMIGSRRKKAMIFDQLKKEGTTQKRLDEVYAPVGLDIHAQTPAEISISIVAEMIKVRAEDRVPGKKTGHV